jgi:hypothetical protein
VRTFFVLDNDTGLIHIFKNIKQDKPNKTISLSGGSFPEQQRIISDPAKGTVIPSFEFKLRKRKTVG